MLLRGLGLAALAYGLFCAVLFLAQRSMIYLPARAPAELEERRAAALGLAAWRAPGGALLGWRIREARGGTPALLFHGNAGSALDRALYAAALVPQGIDVRLVEYPGYGARDGAPGEAVFTAAADEALAALRAEGADGILLVGESLGSGPACALAGRQPAAVRGLLLVTPFRSLREVAAARMPFVPSLLLRDRFEAWRHLAAYPGPLAVLLAGRDEVLGAAQGQALYDGHGGRKRLWVQPEATHNGLDLSPGNPFWAEGIAFLGVGPSGDGPAGRPRAR